MYSGTYESVPSAQQYQFSATKKTAPLRDLLFMFGVLGSLYSLILADKFIF